jgi:hypothetical protein
MLLVSLEKMDASGREAQNDSIKHSKNIKKKTVGM